nr:hypothetical protein Iba_scaffold46476CG0010 [Ipomoea batatas]
MPLDACLTLPVLVASFHTPLIVVMRARRIENPRSSHPAARVPGAGAASIARLSSSEERRRRGGRRFQRREETSPNRIKSAPQQEMSDLSFEILRIISWFRVPFFCTAAVVNVIAAVFIW